MSRRIAAPYSVQQSCTIGEVCFDAGGCGVWHMSASITAFSAYKLLLFVVDENVDVDDLMLKLVLILLPTTKT
jgi:hypothetical protein